MRSRRAIITRLAEDSGREPGGRWVAVTTAPTDRPAVEIGGISADSAPLGDMMMRRCGDLQGEEWAVRSGEITNRNGWVTSLIGRHSKFSLHSLHR